MKSQSPNDWRPIIVAHRGFWLGNFPENSRSAFERAEQFGFPAECDVHRTLEGEPVVIHDETLDRTSTGSGLLEIHSVEQIRRVRLKHPGGVFAEPPPMLVDVAGLVALVEIKPPDAKSLVRKVIKTMAGRRWLLQSFDARNIEHALGVDSSTSVAMLVDSPDGFETAIGNRWNVHADHKLLDDRRVGRLCEHELRIGAWTVNTEPDILRVLQLRPDVIISDQPTLVQRVIEEAGLKVGEFR